MPRLWPDRPSKGPGYGSGQHGNGPRSRAPVEDDELFVTTAQLVTVWPADEKGKLVGEDIYFGENSANNIERITRDEIPDYYQI